MNYLALGDSYTIGEDVPLRKNWPHQLVKQLKKDGLHFEEPKIIAVTGWRTDELIDAIEKDKENLASNYDLVSLLIGVNNQYQNKPISQYKKELTALIEIGLSKSKHGAKGMFMLSIPDYGLSQFAKNKELSNASEEVAKYNQVAKKIAADFEVPFYDITSLSQTTEGNKKMYAKDELHPSAKQYKLWLSGFYEDVRMQIEHIVAKN